ncbi:hypothetical protein [Breoghania sp.]|uniref:DUF6969 family protein n=1 Tax=Breoghania sp. TaxID=2065378 RepID=UPI002604D792|nr:hypothetical protein [Breoghania sp.]MDJ0932055.1 hypothetical protein [Breoghania sp.]
MGFAEAGIQTGDAGVAVPDFSDLARDRLEAMHDAASTVLTCERALAKSGTSVVAEVLRNQGDFLIWKRYPRGDVQDEASQYFYHSHTLGEMMEGENGHFHLFGARPVACPALSRGSSPEPSCRRRRTTASSISARSASTGWDGPCASSPRTAG